MTRRSAPGRNVTTGLLLGLVITLAAVVVYSAYITRQISGLRGLQTDLADRNRLNSLQLLRIQNNLNSLGLAMRDMLDGDQPYPLTAWSAQLRRIRVDLEDALAREAEVAVVTRTPDQHEYLGNAFSQFWDAVDRMFVLAAQGGEEQARDQIRLSLQARQAALSAAVARALVDNNASEEQTAQRIQAIYGQVQRQVYVFLAATLGAIVVTSAFLIRTNRRLFAEMTALADERSELAQQLIATREATLRQISRELHDEFGQILTAMGSMLGRAEKHAPEGSSFRGELREIAEIAQSTLDNVRSLSQTLHPAVLDEAGLEVTLEGLVATFQRQTGIAVSYDRAGRNVPVDSTRGIHIYRVVQESLNNVARHSGADRVHVRLHYKEDLLEVEVEDHGCGIGVTAKRRGLGLVAMRERASLLNGTLEFTRPPEGGTLVRLRVPITAGPR